MGRTPSRPVSAKTTKTPASSAVASTTAVRNTPLPKVTAASSPAPAAKRVITHDMIARRAYEISRSAACSSETDNWLRAERELRGA